MTKTLTAFRIEDEINQAFRDKCAAEGRSMNAVINRLIEQWLKGKVDFDERKKRA